MPPRGRCGPGWLRRWLRGVLPRWLPWGRVREVFVPLLRGEPGPVEPVVRYSDEARAFILVCLEGLTQEEAAERMGLSRAALWRLLDSARRKLARALAEGAPLVIAEYP